MVAEYHVYIPLVPNRDSCFARYCTKHSEGVWDIVDVSFDNILRGFGPSSSHVTIQFKICAIRLKSLILAISFFYLI